VVNAVIVAGDRKAAVRGPVTIVGFAIGGYRSLGASAGYVGPLTKVNLLVGQNNSGKSNVLRFVSDYFDGIREQRAMPDIGGLNLPLFPEAPGLTIALAVSQSWARTKLVTPEFERSDADAALAIDAVLAHAAFTHELDGLLWIRYSATPGTGKALTPSAAQIVSVQDGLAPRLRDGIRRASAAMTGSTGGQPHEDLQRVLGRLDLLHEIPPVHRVDAFRQVRAEGSGTVYSGSGIIAALARLQNPIATSAEEDRRQFAEINGFVQEVLGDPTASIEIPFNRETINVQLNGRLLPLDNLGTGVHEVVILATASTMLQDAWVCIEEPEIHAHPLLQRKLLRYLSRHTSNTYLIATHSAHLLDSGLASVFHVTLETSGTKVARRGSPREIAAIVRDLGYRPSDLVQSNAIVWVEGPSDRIYVNHWIALLDSSLVEGTHYSVMFYGGRLLRHLTANDPEVDEFISLRRLNRHIAILIDSDRSRPSQPLGATKRRVTAEFSAGPGFAWVTHGSTIENYAEPATLAAAVATVHPHAKTVWTGDPWANPLAKDQIKGRPAEVDKIKIAREVVRSWRSVGARGQLRKKVEALVAFIHEANNGPGDT
jgi:hypothetical protein